MRFTNCDKMESNPVFSILRLREPRIRVGHFYIDRSIRVIRGLQKIEYVFTEARNRAITFRQLIYLDYFCAQFLFAFPRENFSSWLSMNCLTRFHSLVSYLYVLIHIRIKKKK